MHKEQQTGSLDTGVEAYHSNGLDHIGFQFRGYPHLDHADKAPQFPDFGVSIEGYASEFNISDGHDYWHPQRGHALLHDSRPRDIFDGYPLKRPDRSSTWPSGYQDSGYGSQFGGDTQSLTSVPTYSDSRTEISYIPDETSSYINEVTKSRQPRTKSIEENKLRCNMCHWVGKTPSEKRFTRFCVRFFNGLLT